MREYSFLGDLSLQRFFMEPITQTRFFFGVVFVRVYFNVRQLKSIVAFVSYFIFLKKELRLNEKTENSPKLS